MGRAARTPRGAPAVGPHPVSVRAAVAAMQTRLAEVDPALVVCVAGRDWRCWCGTRIDRGAVHVRLPATTIRCHEPCAVAMWTSVRDNRQRVVEPIDLDALLGEGAAAGADRRPPVGGGGAL